MQTTEEIKEEEQEVLEELDPDSVAEDSDEDESIDWDGFDEEENSDDPMPEEQEEASVDEGDDNSDFEDSDWEDSEEDESDEESPEELPEAPPEAPEKEEQEEEIPVVESPQEEHDPVSVPDQPKDQNLEMIDRLLTDLGYEGSPEEKLEKYKKENGIAEPEQNPDTEQNPEKNPETQDAESDLEVRAKRDLDTLAKAYPERMKGVRSLNEIPNFQNVIQKMVQTGCSMLDAYTSEIVEKEPNAKSEKKKTQEAGKRHLVGTQTVQRSGRFDPDTAELHDLKRSFPHYSEEKIRELYRKVQKHTR